MKRSINLAGRKTSVTLEDEFWQGMRSIARGENTTLVSLISRINGARHSDRNLSSAIRVFVLNYFQQCRGDQFCSRAPASADEKT